MADTIGTDVSIVVGATTDTESLENAKRRMAEFQKAIEDIFGKSKKTDSIFKKMEKDMEVFTKKGSIPFENFTKIITDAGIKINSAFSNTSNECF